MTDAPSAGMTTGSISKPYPTPAPSFGRLIMDRVKASGSKEAFKAPNPDGSWRSITWQETYDSAVAAAAGLVALGVELEQRVSIASNTRYEWIVADYAVMLAGAATTTVYPTTGEEDVAYILSDSDTKVLIAEDQEQADKALNRPEGSLPDLHTVVLIDGDGNGSNVLSWAELEAKGRELLQENPGIVEERVDATGPDGLATLIYTSGTTGKPKGVELTHGNWTYEGCALEETQIIIPEDMIYLWLPLSHSFGKVVMSVHLKVNCVMAVDGRVPELANNLRVLRPTLMPAVPRIFEKINAGIVAKANAEGGMKAKIFNWAFDVGRQAHQKRLAGEDVGALLGAQLNIADKLVFSKIREGLGGRLRFSVSGSAALAADINSFFQIAGVPILEGYGLTETSAGTTLMRPGNVLAGTVGEPFAGTEAKIAPDGEILLRGPGVMRGYRNRPDDNEEVFSYGDGWFATGDIGEIDDGGRLKITDRKKDLVKTSGGKYIATGAMEAELKANCPLAEAGVIIANNRKFASALIALDPDAIKAWADSKGLSDSSVEALATNPELIADMQAGIDSLNAGLNHWERIKQFRILPTGLTIEGGELTPSMKVRRKVVEDHNADLIDSMYAPRT